MIDPSKPDRILVGGMSLWRTDDAKTRNDDTALTGPAWAEVKLSGNVAISAIAISPANSDIVWVGYENGQVSFTTNGTNPAPQWRQVGGGPAFNLSLTRYCSSIYVARDGSNEVYVSYAAYRGATAGGNIWRTVDNGASWTDLGQTLPDAPVHKVSKHPTQAGYLYVGTEIGLFASDDDGVNWAPTNQGPTNSPVYDIIWLGNDLVCSTHGRGMWRITI